MKKPNLVFIFADQWRASAVGYNGDPNVKTANIDKLAQESINFTNTISNCPICTPYRASLMTGQYPLTNGIFMNDLCLVKNVPDITFFAEAYKNAGYETAYIGKWHIDGHGRTSYIPQERRLGFEDYWKVLECTHDYWDSKYYENDSEEIKKWEGYDTFAQTEDAINYLETRKKDKPFVLMLSYGTPHNPYQTAVEKYKELYDIDKIKLPPNVSENCKENALQDLQGYYGHITAMDKCIGQIVNTLDQQGLAEDTIFVLTSDHGDCVWSHCSSQVGNINKQRPYEESIKVPFLLRYPTKFGSEPKEITTPMATPDIMPTLLELSGVEIPDSVEGVSFASHLIQEEKLNREAVLIASYAPFADWKPDRGGREYRGVRTERYTYIRDLSGPWLLFDNQVDSYQLNNLIDDPEYKEIKSHLDKVLQKILKEQNDSFLSGKELCKKWGYHGLDDDSAIPYHGAKGKEWFAKAKKLRNDREKEE